MRHFFITVLSVIVGGILFMILMLFALAGIGAALGASSTPDNNTSGSTVLTLDLRQSFQDHSSGTTLLGSPPASVVNTALALNRAKTDKNVKGLLIRSGYGIAPASAEEVRLAIQDFQESGKFVIAHSQGFESTSILPYLTISTVDEIWQQDTTGFAVAGLQSETGFYGGVFEKFDAKAEFVQFHEYKNAANVYTKSDFTHAHREATTSFLTSIYDSSVDAIAQDRGLSTEKIQSHLQRAPHSAEKALELGLIDKLGHYIDAENYAKTKAGGKGVKLKTVKSYGPATSTSGSVIAFVGGQGPITMGGSQDGSNPFSSSISMGGDTISKAIITASRNKKVKAIIFRVSSPGGSATASDQILDAVKIAQDAGKPVIISMGQYAASGGYYVSASADRIISMPTTITGSIGVLGGKVAMRDTYAKVGFNVEGISIGGDYLGVYSGDEPFTDAQRDAYRSQMQDIYTDFTSLVADGRGIPIERVEEIAKGRVWTGAQAKEIGLVDEFGGIMKAISVARELAGIDEDSKVYLETYPRPKTTTQQIEELFNTSTQTHKDLSTLREIANLPEVQALVAARTQAAPLTNEPSGLSLHADLPVIK